MVLIRNLYRNLCTVYYSQSLCSQIPASENMLGQNKYKEKESATFTQI